MKMKKIELTKGKFAIVDDEDFDFLNQWEWCYTSSGYAMRTVKIDGKDQFILMHRLINGTPKGMYTDHKNGDGLDNRKINLRNATNSNNQMNRINLPGGTSAYRGVSWASKARKWKSAIKLNQKSINLGYFDDESEAAKAYNDAAEKYHGVFARLNDIRNT